MTWLVQKQTKLKNQSAGAKPLVILLHGNELPERTVLPEMVGTRHTSPQLPSLGADVARPTPSASLRGKYHNKVPEIANQPLNTLLPQLKDDVVHPEPYYITQNVV